MTTLQTIFSAAVSIALALAVFAGSVTAFVFPFVLAAGHVSQSEIAGIASLWIAGSIGLLGVFVALRH